MGIDQRRTRQMVIPRPAGRDKSSGEFCHHAWLWQKSLRIRSKRRSRAPGYCRHRRLTLLMAEMKEAANSGGLTSISAIAVPVT
jgi:hypothetical protein